MKSNRSKRIGLLVGVAAGLLCSGLIGVVIGAALYASNAPREREPVLGHAPAYQGLTNQLGDTVDSSRFRGKVRVVTFLFPYCTTYCPLIASHLVGFENLLKVASLQNRVQLVAFNVAPATTGPKQMRAFLKEYGWNPDNLHWQYLTGKPKEIRHVITGGFHIAYRRVPDNAKDPKQAQGPEQTPQPEVVNPLAEKAHVNYDVTHNDGVIVVDAQGRIRKIYDQADTLSNRDLFKAVKPLLTQR